MSRELKWLDPIVSHQPWIQMLWCGTSFGSHVRYFLYVSADVVGWMRQWSGLWAVALSETELLLLRPFLARCL